MDGAGLANLTDFFDHVEAPDRSLVVLQPSGQEPMVRMLDEGFAGQAVDVADPDAVAAEVPDSEDVVALVEDGEVVRTSPMEAVTNSYLLVNSDLYRTGTVGLAELDPPAVLTELDETVFSLRGFPASNKEKLLLILISRYIERLAWEADDGVLRSSFQRLSRIEDERGTRQVYDELGDSGVDVHVYGVPDSTPSEDWSGTVHGGYSEPYRRSWFVVFRPPWLTDQPETERQVEAGTGTADGGSPVSAAEAAALVAVETGENEWDGMWTYRPGLVADIEAYIQRAL
jgi:DICT domain-containing protein